MNLHINAVACNFNRLILRQHEYYEYKLTIKYMICIFNYSLYTCTTTIWLRHLYFSAKHKNITSSRLIGSLLE